MTEEKTEKKSIRFDYNTFAVVFLAAMFLLAAFQTMQLTDLKAQVDAQGLDLASAGSVGAGSANLASSAIQQQTTQNTIPDSLKNVPNMVGGC